MGPAFAVLLFARVDVLGVAWLRIAAAAAVFAAWRRPWRGIDGRSTARGGGCCRLGGGARGHELLLYEAIDRLPLATVAAIEFLGVIVVAAVGLRSARNLLALVLAAAGVYVLTGVRFAGAPLGVAFALANAALFARSTS